MTVLQPGVFPGAKLYINSVKQKGSSNIQIPLQHKILIRILLKNRIILISNVRLGRLRLGVISVDRMSEEMFVTSDYNCSGYQTADSELSARNTLHPPPEGDLCESFKIVLIFRSQLDVVTPFPFLSSEIIIKTFKHFSLF